MSRIGRAPIPVPSGVTVDISGQKVTVTGPKGILEVTVAEPIRIAQEDESLVVTRPTDRGPHRALHGLSRTLVANMVEGVTDGFERKLELVGVGYRAQMKGTELERLGPVGRGRPGAPPVPLLRKNDDLGAGEDRSFHELMHASDVAGGIGIGQHLHHSGANPFTRHRPPPALASPASPPDEEE